MSSVGFGPAIVVMAFFGLAVFMPAMAHAQQDVEVTMGLSKSTILLGEPVWVVVTAQNVSEKLVRFNPGDYCFNRQMPVVAVAPDAAPGNGKRERCQYGEPGGSCMVGGNTAKLKPGQSATWRFLLEGNFHFVRAGTYRVEMTLHPERAYGADDKSLTPEKRLPVSQTLRLQVLRRNDAALLALEKQMAADLEAQMWTSITQPGHGAISLDDRDVRFRESQNTRRMRSGLAAQPAPGMEEVFEHWLQLPNDFEGDAITGLKSLNSRESRDALAKIAETPNKPNGYTEEAATYALADLGDATYFPLMVRLMASANERVQRAAIRGVGALGGDAAVPVLLDEMRTAPEAESRDAMSALGDTKSRAAVQALIDFISSGRKDSQDASWPLFLLTHHNLPAVKYPAVRTAEQTHDEWQKWWDTGGKDAPVYGPYECAAAEAVQ